MTAKDSHAMMSRRRSKIRDYRKLSDPQRQALALGPAVVPRSELHHCAKLTASRVRQARALAAGGEAVAVLAAMFHVTRPTMRQAIAGETWRHVT